jgi:hypothetical protein
VVFEVDFVVAGVVPTVAGLREELFVRRLFRRGRRGDAADGDEAEEEGDSKRAQAGILRC